MAKYKVELNNAQNLRDLLQEAYKLADEQITQAQNEINKLASATRLQDEVMESKAKYAKAINDYLSIKDKAISKKLDIAKLLSEIYHHNGNVKGALDDMNANKNVSFDFAKIRKMVDESMTENDKPTTIELINKK